MRLTEPKVKYVTIWVVLFRGGGAWVKTIGMHSGDGTYMGGPEAHDRAVVEGKRRSAAWKPRHHVPVLIEERDKDGDGETVQVGNAGSGVDQAPLEEPDPTRPGGA